MKKILLALAILSAQTAVAYDNPRLAISTSNDIILHQENLTNVQDLTTEIDKVNAGIDKYQTCIDKGLIYLGDGASNSDADNCYDVTNTTNSDTNYRPVFEGEYLKFSGAVDTFAFSSAAASKYRSSLAGRFKADSECNSQYPGTRALVYDDLKYVLATLTNPTNIGKNPVWVFDSVLSTFGSSVTAKNLTSYSNFNDCNGWASTNSTNQGGVLVIDNNGSGNFLKFSTQTCTTPAYIACVYN